MSLAGRLGSSVGLSHVASEVKESLLCSAARSGVSPQHITSELTSSVQGQEPSNDVASVAPSVDAAVVPLINQRAVWGLYCSWAMVGIMYGFVANYINIPICQYIFGPLGAPGRATVAQCNIAPTITCIPWNFQVFYGLLLDRVGLFGTRRKGWVIFGWTMALLFLIVISALVDDLVEQGALFTYMFLLMIMCFFYIFATVGCDGMTIEFGKMEPPESRGYILTTGQMVRFGSTIMVNLVGIFGMNGKNYYPKVHGPNSTIFAFELSFSAIHLVLLAMCLPLYVAMVYFLEDPPKEIEEHHSLKTVFETLWTVMKTKVMFCLIMFGIMSTAICSLLNPGMNVIANIVAPSTFQVSVGTFIGNMLFLVGVWIFRTYCMNKNWRITFIWTAMLLATNGTFQLIMISNTWGFGQTGWFYAFGSNILLLVQGVQQVLSSLAVIEVSPPGFEASVYEFLTSMGNSGIALNTNLQNIFLPIFHLNGIAPNYHKVDPTGPEHQHYNNLLNAATYFTIAVNGLAALTFCWFLPTGKQQCREWLTKWHHTGIGIWNLSFGGGVLFFSLTVSVLSALPATSCLQIAGGAGCGASTTTTTTIVNATTFVLGGIPTMYATVIPV